MPESKAKTETVDPVSPQSFEAVEVTPEKLTAEEQEAADAKAEDDAVRERLAAKAEAARFVRVKQDA
jgi:hypothetical protein